MNNLTSPIQTNLYLASEQDFDEIKNLWHICFGDEKAYINEFFSSVSFNSTDNQILVKKIDKKIVSIMFLLGSSIKINNSIYPCLYLFAVTTHPQYRGYGYMSELEQVACKYALSNNILHLTLVPQDADLFNLYSKLGFNTNFFINTSTFFYANAPKFNISIDELDSISFFRMREIYLSTLSFYCKLNDSINNFLCYDFLCSSISLLTITIDRDFYYACLKTQENSITILETSIPTDKLTQACNSLMKYFSCAKMQAITPVSLVSNNINLSCSNNIKTAYGMHKYLGNNFTYNFHHDTGYMNFMLL